MAKETEVKEVINLAKQMYEMLNEKESILLAKVEDEQFNVDVSVLTNDMVFEALEPIMCIGHLVCVVTDCQEAQTQRNGDATQYRVSFAIPSTGDRIRTAMGYIQPRTNKSYWLNVPKQVAIGETFVLHSNSFNIVLGVNKHDINKPHKNFEFRDSMAIDGKLNTERFERTKDNKGNDKMITIQGNQFKVYDRVKTINLDV